MNHDIQYELNKWAYFQIEQILKKVAKENNISDIDKIAIDLDKNEGVVRFIKAEVIIDTSGKDNLRDMEFDRDNYNYLSEHSDSNDDDSDDMEKDVFERMTQKKKHDPKDLFSKKRHIK